MVEVYIAMVQYVLSILLMQAILMKLVPIIGNFGARIQTQELSYKLSKHFEEPVFRPFSDCHMLTFFGDNYAR